MGEIVAFSVKEQQVKANSHSVVDFIVFSAANTCFLREKKKEDR